MVSDGSYAEPTTRQVIDQRGGCPGTVGSVGVQVEIDGVRRRQGQWLRRRGCRSNVLSGSARRVCQGEASENALIAATTLLPGSLTDAG